MSKRFLHTPPGGHTMQGVRPDPSYGGFSAILTDFVVWLLATDPRGGDGHNTDR